MSKKKYEVKLLTSANEDLTDIINYVADERLDAAIKLADKFEKYFKLLEATPKLGRIPKEKELEYSGYRVVVIENYLLFYKMDKNTIYVHRIIHGARDYISLL